MLSCTLCPQECTKKETLLPYADEQRFQAKMSAADPACCVDEKSALLATVKQHKQAVSHLLGYTPNFESGSECVYRLLPIKCMPKAKFLERTALLSGLKATHEERLKEVQDARSFGTEYQTSDDVMQSIQMEIDASKTALLSHLLSQTPVDEQAFRNRLALHLDAMLDALLELRSLEMGTLDDVAKK